jgi:hypothetical protein
MTLVPAPLKCMEVGKRDPRQNLVMWRLTPGQAIVYGEKKESTANADISGMWHPGNNVDGKVCRR